MLSMRFYEKPRKIQTQLLKSSNLRDYDCDGLPIFVRKVRMKIEWTSTAESIHVEVYLNKLVLTNAEKEKSYGWHETRCIWQISTEGYFIALCFYV